MQSRHVDPTPCQHGHEGAVPPEILSVRQQAIIPVAAWGAAGDLPRLAAALNQGLDAGLTVYDSKEVLIQLYAYAGFPLSLNALSELLKVVDARKQRGLQDAPGQSPTRPIPTGDVLLAAGAANQTRILGEPAKGAIYDFEPMMAMHMCAESKVAREIQWSPVD